MNREEEEEEEEKRWAHFRFLSLAALPPKTRMLPPTAEVMHLYHQKGFSSLERPVARHFLSYGSASHLGPHMFAFTVNTAG